MRRAIMVCGIILTAVFFSAGCQKTQGTGMETTNDQKVAAATAETPSAEAAMATIVVNATPFTVEIAETSEQKEKGLMGRETLPENNGMWFVFDGPVQEKFWMKDTQIALDIFFVDETMKVVSIKENAVPGSAELIEASAPFKFVLEVNAGAAAKHGLKAGDTVEKRVGGK